MIRRNIVPIGVIIAVSSLVSFIASCPKRKEPSRELHRVIRVIDGDTIIVSYHGQEERVRLLRIDTPERGQPRFHEATETITSLIGDQAVRLEFEEPGKIDRDIYGRILAYVWVNGTMVNLWMVRAGWSKFWTKYGAGKYADEFQQAEQEAME